MPTGGACKATTAYKIPKSEEAAIFIDLVDCPSPESDPSTPPRPILCIKQRVDMKKFEAQEDCFILEFDPYDSISIAKLSVTEDGHNADLPDISVVAEKGHVACRDYPHSRNVCAKHPFETTPHDRHCEMCYCFVCDIAAPCQHWTGVSGHCHAIDNEAWKLQRITMRETQKTKK
ncbi:hypothetical protein RJ640_028325 [Escallonia rubra]|uniref:Uncharacterized protein n=1 Tax=Escallonia rubra TaxID=112253 RepID=A0AA88UF34_9ASTE|nr:hypothetical protein RJ640_028325 [Escallonia rubra]